MKIAILSDIHGNSYALKNVLYEIKKLNINRIFILGDMIGYYYGIDIFKQLEPFECDFIAGNHEEMFKKVIKGEIDIKKISEKYGKGLEIFIKNGRDKDKKFITNLEINKILNINNLKIGLFHGSPNKVDEYIYPDTDEKKLKSLNKENFDFIFIGHTHRSFIFSQNNFSIVNVGSVGQNRVKGGYASWVILNTDNKCIQFMNTKFNINNLLYDIRNDNNNYIKNILKRS